MSHARPAVLEFLWFPADVSWSVGYDVRSDHARGPECRDLRVAALVLLMPLVGSYYPVDICPSGCRCARAAFPTHMCSRYAPIHAGPYGAGAWIAIAAGLSIVYLVVGFQVFPGLLPLRATPRVASRKAVIKARATPPRGRGSWEPYAWPFHRRWEDGWWLFQTPSRARHSIRRREGSRPAAALRIAGGQ